ncbi:HAD family hydrolase [Frigidibacter mobilis]|uniref:HAD family hydrolase n=1 Tax=Frigidibacter mobilis TaxID=1335048 RepID=A0A165SME6_9RHOB|nr:HAD family phosphatase [Frigidibacter mobilis]AMY69409.1 HAD family hydrolase [Frigidibacter mobilis]
MKAIVFDIGNVLVRWDPELAFMGALGSREAARAFIERIGFAALNLRADGGETFADLATEIDGAGDRALFAGYPAQYHLTIAELLDGTWALMDRLRAKGHPIHAITNWSAETWEIGVDLHPRLGSAFGTTIVSGREKVLKPQPQIFALLCERAGLAPADCLFIDDSASNVAGAAAFGMDAILFTAPEALEISLTERGLL